MNLVPRSIKLNSRSLDTRRDTSTNQGGRGEIVRISSSSLVFCFRDSAPKGLLYPSLENADVMTHDTSKPCGQVEHVYRNYSIVWCPHRQQFTLRSSKYLETGREDDPVDYVTRALALGPFDSARDCLEIMLTWLEEDLAAGLD
jgi:hypothetical protein